MLTKQDIIDYPRYNLIKSYFPDNGKFSREKYPRQLEFFKATFDRTEVMFKAANRVGKSDAGAYIVACIATGIYPDWWEGCKLYNPKGLLIWVAGTTAKTTREIIQEKLVGAINDIGTGMIPKTHLIKNTKKMGVGDAFDTTTVKHINGTITTIVYKSFDQGRKAFEGKEVDFIWGDEANKEEVYVEMVLRTMTTNGRIVSTFTNLEGLTPLVLQFCPNGIDRNGAVENSPTKYMVRCEWDDVPHLTEEMKINMMAAIPPWQRDARAKGLNTLGSGLIYPVDDDFIKCAPFEIPESWPRCFSFDVGTFNNACGWFAMDPNTNIDYLYDMYYCCGTQKEAIIHADAIKSRGDWIPGIVDFQAHANNPTDLKNLFTLYEAYGLNLTNANKSVVAGLEKTWQSLNGGTLKVFSNLTDWFVEKRMYRRDEKGEIIKQNDHAMDFTRYKIMTPNVAISKPSAKPTRYYNPWQSSDNFNNNASWMRR